MTLQFLQIVLIDARTFMSYLVRAVIRPRDRSSGEISTVTLSPAALRALVQAAPDAVADDLAHQRVAGRLGRVLDGARDVAHVAGGPDRVDAGGERPPGDLHQPLRLGRDPPDGHGHGRVAVVALGADAEVEPHDIPLAQRPPARRDPG